MKSIAQKWLVWSAALVAVALVAGIAVYRTQDIFDWPKTFAGANDVAQMIALVVGGLWALWHFVLTRGSRTFLQMSVTASVVGGNNETVLVAIVVRLENKGASRITARTSPRKKSGLFFDDTWDQVKHAGTLKVRAVSPEPSYTTFNWYALAPLAATLTELTEKGPGTVVKNPGTLEEINFLDHFLDEDTKFAEVDFWLEPSEAYELTVPLWLRPGDYAIKAYFLGQETGPHEDEYWSHHAVFRLQPPVSTRNGSRTSVHQPVSDAD